MRSKSQLLFACVVCYLASNSIAFAGLKEGAISTSTNDIQVLKVSDLRSAYLVQAGVVAYDADQAAPEMIRWQLQRHFDVVVGLLMLWTPESLEVALDRLELSRGAAWSDAEREAWRRILSARRVEQLRRLVAYRDRGRFPLNERHATQATPIFVDRHGTACAVGHLMRLAGFEDEVSGIERDNNLVYVPEIRGGPVARWVLTSGLTIEEAAVIQPAYGVFPPIVPPPQNPLPIDHATSFVQGDLKYSNFRLFLDPESEGAPPVNVHLNHNTCGLFGCTFFPPFPPIEFDPDPRVFELDMKFDPSWIEISPLPLPETVWPWTSRVVIQFDVEVTSPNLRIAGIPFGGSLTPLLPSGSSRNNLLHLYFESTQSELFISDDGIYSLNASANSVDYATGVTTAGVVPLEIVTPEFEPRKSMTIVTEMFPPVAWNWQHQYLHFHVAAVPEPSSASLVVGLALLALSPATRLRSRRAELRR